MIEATHIIWAGNHIILSLEHHIKSKEEESGVKLRYYAYNWYWLILTTTEPIANNAITGNS